MSLPKSFYKNIISICQGLSGMLIPNPEEVMYWAPLMTSSLNLLELSYIINSIVQTIFLERTFCLKAHHPSTELELSTRDSLNQCTTIWYAAQLQEHNIYSDHILMVKKLLPVSLSVWDRIDTQVPSCVHICSEFLFFVASLLSLFSQCIRGLPF